MTAIRQDFFMGRALSFSRARRFFKSWYRAARRSSSLSPQDRAVSIWTESLSINITAALPARQGQHSAHTPGISLLYPQRGKITTGKLKKTVSQTGMAGTL